MKRLLIAAVIGLTASMKRIALALVLLSGFGWLITHVITDGSSVMAVPRQHP
jgi:hypothetical protein